MTAGASRDVYDGGAGGVQAQDQKSTPGHQRMAAARADQEGRDRFEVGTLAVVAAELEDIERHCTAADMVVDMAR